MRKIIFFLIFTFSFSSHAFLECGQFKLPGRFVKIKNKWQLVLQEKSQNEIRVNLKQKDIKLGKYQENLLAHVTIEIDNLCDYDCNGLLIGFDPMNPFDYNKNEMLKLAPIKSKKCQK